MISCVFNLSHPREVAGVLKIDDQASIGDDVFAAGFSLEAKEQSSINGEMMYAGYQASAGR